MIADFQIWYMAATAWVHGQNPYQANVPGAPGFYGPVWALIPFVPLTLLPYDIARIAWGLITLIGLLIVAGRLGRAQPGDRSRLSWIALFLLLSPWLWANLVYANIDWLVLLGSTLSPLIGIWLVTMKPHMAIGLMLLWGVAAWRRERLWGVGKLIGPLAVAGAVQAVTVGLPPIDIPTLKQWNASLWPFTLPLGATLILYAAYRGKVALALAATPLALPYVRLTSWLMIWPWASSLKARWGAVALSVSWLGFAIWRISLWGLP